MAELIKRLNHDIFEYGDIARLSRAVKGSGGKRFKFIGAVYDSEEAVEPIYYDLIEIGRGQFRSIRPEHVIKDIPASKAAQARIAKKAVK